MGGKKIASTGQAKKVMPEAEKPTTVVNSSKKSKTPPSVNVSILALLVISVVSFAFGVLLRPFQAYVHFVAHPAAVANVPNLLTEAGSNSSETRELDCDDLLDTVLHDERQAGMDVICIHKNFTLQIYLGASIQAPVEVVLDSESNVWASFRNVLEQILGLKQRNPINQAWALFSTNGVRLADEMSDFSDNEIIEKLQTSRVAVVMGGGQWLWPGVRIGFKRSVELSHLPGTSEILESPRNVTLETLSLYPLVVSVQGFLSEEECEHIKTKAEPTLRYSEVTLQDFDKGRPSSDFRTSQSTFLVARGDSIVKGIDERTASLVRIPRNHQEHVQVLRYGRNEKYDAHLDYFDPNTYKKDKATMNMIENGKKNRLATVFWYLTDVEEGGHTAFPRFNKGPLPHDYSDCSRGLLVKPERGKVIIFYSLTYGGSRDAYSLHGACAVKEGVKWAANKWVWNKPMRF